MDSIVLDKTENPGASAEAIRYHYDRVGTDFYSLWLDPTLSYSSAIWEEGEGHEDHEAAQLRKLDCHIEQAQVKGAKRVLDVGCGWGALLRRLVEVHGVEQATGLSLSQAQLDYVASFGNPNIELRLESWSDHEPEECYDGIISLDVLEHFARPGKSSDEKVAGYRDFFNRCHRWLKPGGIFSLQTMVYGYANPEQDFNQFISGVVPESDHARQFELFKAADGIFEVLRFWNIREHYVKTLRAWRSNLRKYRAEAAKLVGEEVVDHYEKYVSYYLIGMHTGTMDDSIMVMRRLDNPRY